MKCSTMWTPRTQQQDETNKDICGTCGHEVESEQRALECYICERWEHVECVRQPDRIEASLYVELVANPSKALLFCCTVCWHKGCIVKQLYKLQSELAVVSEQWLASTHTVDEARDLIKCLQADKARLQAEVDELRGLLYKTVLSFEPKAEQITARVGKAKSSRSATTQTSVATAGTSLYH